MRLSPSTYVLLLASLMPGCSREQPSPADVAADSDGDGILDVHEGDADPDNDRIPARLDQDSDGDGIGDQIEAGDTLLETLPLDVDSDGTPDFLDLDSDGNGLSDTLEGLRAGGQVIDTDRDGHANSSDLDDDGDGVPDRLEMRAPGEDRDSDATGRVDRLDLDSDGDQLADADEAWCLGEVLCDTDADGTPDILDLDSDGDGSSDALESGATGERIAAPPRDTDGDGTYDARDLDSDADGLRDDAEVKRGTDPYASDSDGDGLSDGVEVDLELDPLDAESRWRGPIIMARPRHSESTKHTIVLDELQVDVVLDTRPGASRFERFAPFILDALQALLPPEVELSVGAGTPGTFASFPWGCEEEPLKCGWEEVELRLITKPQPAVYPVYPITPELDRLRAHLAKNRADYHDREWFEYTAGERAYALPEFWRQLVDGVGIDLHCDGVFDPDVDLAPWPRDSEALFGGVASDPVPLPRRHGPVGTLGGRRHAKLIVMHAFASSFVTMNPGAPVPSSAPECMRDRYGAPPSCPAPVTFDEAVAALDRAGASLIVGPTRSRHTGGTCEVPDSLYMTAMLERSALSLGSAWDPDGDGIAEPYRLWRDLDEEDAFDHLDPSEKADHIAERLGPILTDIFDKDLKPDTVTIEVRDDPHGFITRLTPSAFASPALGDTLGFELDWVGALPPKDYDEAHVVTLEAMGDGQFHWGQVDVLFVVPGR